MSKPPNNVLLLPGSQGWEIWEDSPANGYQRSQDEAMPSAASFTKKTSGQLLMAFPVREALAIPFVVNTTEEGMFEDLASMHIEKKGIRLDPNAGRLMEVFPVAKNNKQTLLLTVVLAAPREGTMPLHSPSEFDISARCFPFLRDAITLWNELGRWVFSVTHGKELVYFQSFSNSEIGKDTAQEIRLALTQLQFSGFDSNQSKKCVVWISSQSSNLTQEALDAFAEALGTEVDIQEKPQPISPLPLSQIEPADIRAERRSFVAKRQRNRLITTALFIYLAIATYFGYNYFKLHNKLKAQQSELARIQSESIGSSSYYADWQQLSSVVDEKHWPLTALRRCHELILPWQDLRLTTFEGRETSILISGDSAKLKTASSFGEKLRNKLPDYVWSLPVPQSHAKTKRWKFRYEGTLINKPNYE